MIKYGEPLNELQRDELRTAVEKLRRQMLRKSREYDCQILQERMELLHQAHQVWLAEKKNDKNGWQKRVALTRNFFFCSTKLQRIRDLEDKTEIQRRQIKDLEEKVKSTHGDALLSWNHNICCHSSILSHHLCPFPLLTFHSFSFYSCSFLSPLSFGLKVCGVSSCEGEFRPDHNRRFSGLWSKLIQLKQNR